MHTYIVSYEYLGTKVTGTQAAETKKQAVTAVMARNDHKLRFAAKVKAA